MTETPTVDDLLAQLGFRGWQVEVPPRQSLAARSPMGPRDGLIRFTLTHPNWSGFEMVEGRTVLEVSEAALRFAESVAIAPTE